MSPALGGNGAGAASFDRVAIRSDDGATRELTREQFMALPLAERIEVILQRKPQFYRGDRPVPPRAALKGLY